MSHVMYLNTFIESIFLLLSNFILISVPLQQQRHNCQKFEN